MRRIAFEAESRVAASRVSTRPSPNPSAPAVSHGDPGRSRAGTRRTRRSANAAARLASRRGGESETRFRVVLPAMAEVLESLQSARRYRVTVDALEDLMRDVAAGDQGA